MEFADETGRVAHRFTLTPESDLDEFLAWMRLHQACAAHQSPAWFAEEDAAVLEPARALRGCKSSALEAIVRACMAWALPLRVTVRGAAATQRAEFVPRSLQPSAGWWFASDDTTGLHFQPELLERVTLEQQPRDKCRSAVVVVRAAGEDDATALVLEAGSREAEDAWHTLLEATA